MKLLNDKLSVQVWESIEEFYLLLGITVVVAISGIFLHNSGIIKGGLKTIVLGVAFHIGLWLTYSPSDPEYYDQNTRISLLFLAAFFYGLSAGPFIKLITTVGTLVGAAIRVNLSAAFYTIAIFLICTLFALTYPEGKYLWLETPLNIANGVIIVLDVIIIFYESRVLIKINLVIIFFMTVFFIPFLTDYVVVGFKNGPGGDMDHLLAVSLLFLFIMLLYLILCLFVLEATVPPS